MLIKHSNVVNCVGISTGQLNLVYGSILTLFICLSNHDHPKSHGLGIDCFYVAHMFQSTILCIHLYKNYHGYCHRILEDGCKQCLLSRQL